MANPALAWHIARCGACISYRSAPDLLPCVKHIDFVTSATDGACWDFRPIAPAQPVPTNIPSCLDCAFAQPLDISVSRPLPGCPCHTTPFIHHGDFCNQYKPRQPKPTKTPRKPTP